MPGTLLYLLEEVKGDMAVDDPSAADHIQFRDVSWNKEPKHSSTSETANANNLPADHGCLP
jgi:hypothetical protein